MNAAHPFAVIASTQVVGGAALLTGWSFRETSGAARATVELRDGSSTGILVGSVGLAASSTDTQWFGDRGIGVYVGLFALVVSGAVSGTVWLIPAQRGAGGLETAEPAWWNMADGAPL